jgi:hypothetical protein
MSALKVKTTSKAEKPLWKNAFLILKESKRIGRLLALYL